MASGQLIQQKQLGYSLAIGSGIIWGLTPLLIKPLSVHAALTVLIGQTLWAALIMLTWLVASGRAAQLRHELSCRKRLFGHLAATTIMACSNLVYIGAIANNHLVALSIGYFICPLLVALAAAVFLQENLQQRERIALCFIGVGIIQLVLTSGAASWITLWVSFAFPVYITIRRGLNLNPMLGMVIETLLMAAAIAVYLAIQPDSIQTLTVIFSTFEYSPIWALYGLAVMLPVLMFQWSSHHVPMNHAAVLIYVSPTLQLSVALFIFGEAMDTATMITLLLAWVGIGIYASGIRVNKTITSTA